MCFVPRDREHVPNVKRFDEGLESTAFCKYYSSVAP